MDLLDKITSEMDNPKPTMNRPKQEPSSSRSNSVWNRVASTSRSQSVVKPDVGTPTPETKQQTVTPGHRLVNQMGRIPKRNLGESNGPDPKKRQIDNESFKPIGMSKVQLNVWPLDISAMDEVLHKILFQVTLLQDNKSRFELNTGLCAVSGDVNRQNRMSAQWTLFRNWFRANSELFNGNVHEAVAAYDGAETIYVPSRHYAGGLEEHKFTVNENHFSETDWKIVSSLSRRKNVSFEIRVKPIGRVYTHGSLALTEENRPELVRCLETVTNQVLNDGNFYLYNTATFAVNGDVVSEPDDFTIIKSGFSKVPRIVQGPTGEPTASIMVDTVLSPFYKPIPLVKFFTSKFAELRGSGSHGTEHQRSRGGGRGDRGGYGGRGEQGRYSDRGDNERFDQRKSRPEENYNEKEVKDLEKMIERSQVSNSTIQQIGSAMKGLEVEAIHLRDGKNSRIIVAGVSNGTARNTVFEWNTPEGVKKISVIDYFYENYSYRLKFPDLPLVFSRRMKCFSFFPIEVLMVLPGQRIKNSSLTTNVQSHMTGRNSSLPSDHVHMSLGILRNSLHLNGSGKENPHLAAFNIRFPTLSPLCGSARILAPPAIKFANNQTAVPDPTKASKISGSGKFVMPARIRTLVVLNMDQHFSRDVQRFTQQFAYHCHEQGITFEKGPKEWRIIDLRPDDFTGTKNVLQECLKYGVTIALAIVQEKKPEIHDVLKYYEEKIGQQTIQMTTETAVKIMSDRGGKQTVDNVLRKFNPKCGGTNFHIDISSVVFGQHVTGDSTGLKKKLFDSTQFIAFELSHPGARTVFEKHNCIIEGDPSVVGVAYSLRQSTQLGGFSYFQSTREHKLSQLTKQFPTCVKAYMNSAKELPKTIVVYRVGSGEGDFKRIIQEVNEMKASIESLKPGYCPKFILILAQRHSHVRMYPEHIEGRRPQDQNVPSGTCLEISVYGQDRQEFILCCQSPMIGTSRPTKYSVLVNDPKWTVNELAQVTYYLSFGHQVSYAPPAVPDVLYAASNLAKRGNNNFKVHKKLDEIQKTCQEVLDKHKGAVSIEDENDLMNLMIEQISDDVNKLTLKSRNFWA